MHTTSQIRSSFLDFFKKNQHQEIASSSLIPHNDPTLLFTAAGMVQFKDVFTGLETIPYKRAVTAQKCLRAGGKHNDLENVGYTNRHHTFFEMLGNFSFGDYFKEEAIHYAWNFVTQELSLPKDRLVITVFSEDDVAAALWKKIAHLSDHQIIRISTTDNFWSMGEVGPCGPCSEIFYDHGDKIAGGPPGSKEADGDRFVEIWNLVFMQYDQKGLLPSGEPNRLPLPRPSIDTGMGLERVTAVLQGVCSNYEIDLFQALIQASVDLTGVPYKGVAASSHRVIADHLRASSFLISEGVLPSNEGRGYVLRRIMRRAMRHAHLLKQKDPLLARLFPALLSQMGGAYPELLRAQTLITETLYLEEKRFQETLDRGLKLLQEEQNNLSSNALFPGQIAFKLYDTYGFPLDLTEDVLKNQGRRVDIKAFQEAMERQKAEARASWTGSGASKTETLWYNVKEKIGASDFLGYETLTAEGIVCGLFKDGQEVQNASLSEKIQIITNQTPFYGESGGQMGDTGVIIKIDETGTQKTRIRITHTFKKRETLIIHEGIVEEGSLALNDAVILKVDQERRDALRANHSATHLLHSALRMTLGSHVVQKGSLVAPDKLRFDFSHAKALTPFEIKAIESRVNTQIRLNTPVITRHMSSKEAISSGAIALFGEKYADDVRVVSMGADKTSDYLSESEIKSSTELCGGTHVTRTGDIGYFKITQETSVASGIRRIEALTGPWADAYVTAQSDLLKDLCLSLKVSPDHLKERIDALQDEKKSFEKEKARLRQRAQTSGENAQESIKKIGSVSIMSLQLTDAPSHDLKSWVDGAKQRLGSGVVLLTNVKEGKVSCLIGITSDLATKHLNAIDLVQEVARLIGGKGGGGRADLAQAGGSDLSSLSSLPDVLEKKIAQKLKMSSD